MKPWRAPFSFFSLAALLLIGGTAPAQIGVFANFTAGTQYRLSSSGSYNSSWTYGPTGGIYAELPLPFFAIGGDLRGTYLNGDQLHHWNGLIGPRVEIKPHSFHPYAEFLVGFGGYRDNFYTSNTTTHVDYAILGGIDKRLIPLIDWRVIEFTYNSYFGNHTPGSKQFSTGLVLRLP